MKDATQILTMRERGTMFKASLLALARQSFKIPPAAPYIVVYSERTKNKWVLHGLVFWNEDDYRFCEDPIIKMKISGKTDEGLNLVDPIEKRQNKSE